MTRANHRRVALLALGIALLSCQAHAYELSGIVVDADHTPLPGAKVWLNQQRAARATISDENGRFAFEGVNVGTVDVVALADGHALGGVRGQLIDDSDVAIVLTAPESIRLRMINTQYEPIAGARLGRLTFEDGLQVIVEDLVPLGFPSIRSDDEGFLTIPALPGDAYVSITISHRDHADATLPAVPAPLELDLPMLRAVKLRGRVTNEDGEGVERARVSVFRTIEGQEHEVAEVLTDTDGFYQANAQPQYYSVAVRHPDYAMPKPLPAALTTDGGDAIVDLVLPAAHHIRGSTLDTEGEPVSMVKLSYSVDDVIYDETVSDVTGVFHLTVSSGTGVLHITPPGRMMTTKFPWIGFEVGDETEVNLDPIELQPLPEIRGRITTQEGVLLDKVLITSLGLDVPIVTTTDEDGAFTIELDRMYEEPIAFRAEHALRFLRQDFEIDPLNIESPEVRLRPFRPNLEQSAPSVSNNLEHMLGEAAPEIQCDAWFNLEPGQTGLSLEALRGKVVVLTLWGGFDTRGSTRQRIEELNALHTLIGDLDDIAFIGVHDASVEPPDVSHYVREFGIEFPIGCDADPFLTFDLYNTNIIPQTILIDKQGNLRYYKVNGRIPELIKDLRRR